MAKYKVQAPNGRTYHLEGPDGASEDEVIQELLAVYPDAENPVEQPSLGASALQGLTSGVASVGRAGIMGAAGLTDLVSPDTADKMFAFGDKLKNAADEAIVSKEDQAAGGFGNTVATALGGLAPAVAASVATANPLVGIGMIAAPAITDTGAELIQKGAPLGEAQGAAAIAGGVAGATAAIPLVGKSIGKAAIAQAVINPITGAAQDKAISSILTDPNLQANYRWNDWEKRGTEAITGAVLGAGFKYAHQQQQKKLLDTIEGVLGGAKATDAERAARIGDFIEKLQLVTDKELGIVKPQYNLNGVAPDAALSTLVKGGGKFTDALDIMTQDTGDTFTNQYQRSIAEKLLERSHAMGLDLTMLDDKVNQDAAGKPAGGAYDQFGDAVNLNPESIKARTIIHEGVHAVLFHATDLYLKNPNKHTLTPEQQQIWERMDKLNKVYQFALKIQAHRLKLKPEELQARIKDLVNGIEPPDLPYEQKTRREENQRNPQPAQEDVLPEMKAELERRAKEQGTEEIDYSQFTPEESAMDQATTPTKPATLNAAHEGFLVKHYGLQDLHEFATETISRLGFQKLLQSMPLTANQYRDLGLVRSGKSMNVWDAVKNLVNKLVGGEVRGTLFDVAMDHVLYNIDQTTASSRKLLTNRYGNDKRAQIAEHNRAMDERTKAGKTTEELKSEGLVKDDKEIRQVLYKLSTIREQVNDDPVLGIKEFLLRAREEFPGPEWEDYLTKNAKTLFNNKERLLDFREKVTPNIPESERKWVMDAQDVKDFADATFGDRIVNGKVVRPLSVRDEISNNAWNYLWGTGVKNILQYEHGVAGKVVKYIQDMAERYKSVKEQFYSRAMNDFKDFYALPRDQAMKLMEVIVGTDSAQMRSTLKKEGRLWLNESELSAVGMNEAQIKAYKGMSKALEDLYDILDITRLRRGEEPLERIPLFMPHVWNGAYKTKLVRTVYALDKIKKEWRQVDQRVIKVFSANNLHTGPVARSLRAYKEAQTKRIDDTTKEVYHLDVNPKLDKPYYITKLNDPTSSMLGTLTEHLEAYQNSLSLSPETMMMLERIEANATIGLNRHAMERSNVSGWMGEEGFSRFNYVKNTQLLELWQRYARAVTEHYGNTAFHDEVMSPLLDTVDPANPESYEGKTRLGRMFENTPQFTKHMREFEKNFTGENPNKFPWVDSFFEKGFTKLGLDPFMMRKTVRGLRSLMAWSKLTFSPAFHSANVLQSMNTGLVLHMIDAERVAAGGKTADIGKAMATGMEKYFRPDAESRAVLEFAKHNHSLDAQLAHELSSVHVEQTNYRKFGSWVKNIKDVGDIVQRIERGGRTASYLMAYEYFKQIHGPGTVAREAAIKAMKLAMVDYDRTSRPLMYQNTGIVGEAFSPFSVFRNNYMGLMLEMGKIIKRNPLAIRSYYPALVWAAMTMLTAGSTGVVLAAEWEALATLWNNNFEEHHLPTFQEMVMDWTNKAPRFVQDAALFGVLDAATGKRIGSSMASVSATDVTSTPLPEFAAALGSLVKQSTFGSNTEARYKALRSVVPSSTWNLSQGLRAKYGVGIPGLGDNAYNQNNEVGLKAGAITGWQTKEPEDYVANLMGMTSTRESREKVALSLDARDEKLRVSRYKNIIGQLADAARDASINVDRDALVRKALELNPDKDVTGIYSDVAREVDDRNLSQKYKIAKKGNVNAITRSDTLNKRMGE